MSVVGFDRSVSRVEDVRRPVAPVRAVRRVGVGLLGYGRVGQAVATLAEAEHARWRAEGVDVHVTGALVRDLRKPRSGPVLPMWTSAAGLLTNRPDVLVEVMGGEHPAFELVRAALEAGVHVVTANKTLVAARGQDLEAVARRHGAVFAFDAAVLAGVPFLGALARRPLIGSPRRITGIINGTSHFVACQIAEGGSFESAIDEATARGYAEPDSSADISGRDAAEKLTILLHLAGCRGLVVADLTTCSLQWLTSADILAAGALGGVIKPAALASLDPANPGAWVGPVLVDRAHPFSTLHGVQNAIEFAGSNGDPVTFAGPGAGPRVTAATILDDVVELVTGGGQPPAHSWRAEPVPAEVLRQPPAGSWYLRIAGAGVSPGDLVLAQRRLPTRSVIERGRALAIRTSDAPWHAVRGVVDTLRSAGRDVLALPIVERR